MFGDTEHKNIHILKFVVFKKRFMLHFVIIITLYQVQTYSLILL